MGQRWLVLFLGLQRGRGEQVNLEAGLCDLDRGRANIGIGMGINLLRVFVFDEIAGSEGAYAPTLRRVSLSVRHKNLAKDYVELVTTHRVRVVDEASRLTGRNVNCSWHEWWWW